MGYSNKKERRFHSDDYVFRQTALSEALQRAGVTSHLHLVREEKISFPVRGVR